MTANIFNTQLLLPSIASVVCITLLSGCGGANEEQDAPLATVDNQVVLTGLTMNGHLANALVWVDLRANNAPDGFEPFAYTDNQGYFSYNPNTGTNYCESTEASNQRFCLKTGAQSGKVVIKATKGIELLSGEAFRSVLTSKTTVQTARDNLSALSDLGARPLGDTSLWQKQIDKVQLKLSPLTSVQYYLPENVSLKTAINNFGYSLSDDITDADIISMDYIAGLDQNDEDAATLFTVDVSLSRLVDVLTLNIDKATQSLDYGDDGLPISSADAVYEGLTSALVNNDSASLLSSARSTSAAYSVGTKATSNSRDKNDLSSVFDWGPPSVSAVSSSILEIISRLNLSNDQLNQRISDLSSNVPLLRQLNLSTHIAFNHFERSRASNFSHSDLLTLNHVVTLPTLTGPIAYQTSVDAAASIALSDILLNQNNEITRLLSSHIAALPVIPNFRSIRTPDFDLSKISSDILTLAKELENDETLQNALGSQQNLIVLTSLANIETPDDSSFWAGNKLSLSGFQDETEQGQIIFYFTGQSSDTSGELIMCIAYKNDQDASDNIEGKLFDGTWSVIGADSQNRLSLVTEGYTIQMKVLGETLGRNIAEDQQIPSLPRMPNESYGEYGFTLNDDTGTWHSDDASLNQSYGLSSADSVPNNDNDCKDLLTLTVP